MNLQNESRVLLERNREALEWDTDALSAAEAVLGHARLNRERSLCRVNAEEERLRALSRRVVRLQGADGGASAAATHADGPPIDGGAPAA